MSTTQLLSVARSSAGHRARTTYRWRPGWLLLLTAVVAIAALTTLTYSPAASWLSGFNQSKIIDAYEDELGDVDPAAQEQLETAAAYNEALASGALLEANSNKPTGAGTGIEDGGEYRDLLTTPSGAMSRLQIPSIDVDLPVYHGTSEATLLKGAGHLQGTSLPVGGVDTRAVITAHRGLAHATMFTNLDRVDPGDTFTVTTLGKVMTYMVIDTRVVAPEDTATLRQQAGRDLLTLVTCTPLGINTHRILVTGERVFPTPAEDVDRAQAPASAGIPWWAVVYVTGLALISAYVWRAGRVRVLRRPGSTERGARSAVMPDADARLPR